MHYTEGWANGFHYDIEYWEIWNEPDLDPDDSTNKRCWSGTEEDFARLYVIAAKHLKNRFPNLKIGGPASAGDEAWMERFLQRITKEENVPIDFFSWHWYWTQPYDMSIKGTRIKRLPEKYGYGKAESILNEWNYVRCWTKEFVYTIKQIIGVKGAAFTSACMIAGQNNPDIDMLMYYDARPGTFNGLWDFYTMEPLKGYYPFYIFANLYELENQASSQSDDDDVYVVSAINNGKIGTMITYYSENDDLGTKIIDVTLDGCDTTDLKVWLVDEENSMSPYLLSSFDNNKISLSLKRNSIIYICN